MCEAVCVSLYAMWRWFNWMRILHAAVYCIKEKNISPTDWNGCNWFSKMKILHLSANERVIISLENGKICLNCNANMKIHKIKDMKRNNLRILLTRVQDAMTIQFNWIIETNSTRYCFHVCRSHRRRRRLHFPIT